jgi:predicted DNA-binding WGR domain protein
MPDSTGSKPPKHEKSALARRHEQTLGTTRIDKGIGMSGQIRRFEFNDGKSSKFWEVEVAGAQFTVRYGKIGTAGQAQTKEFANGAAATKAADKLIAEKAGKGYQEVGGATPMTPASIAAATAPKVAKAPKSPKPTKAKKPAELAKDPDADPAVLEALAGTSEAIDRLLAKNPKASAALLEKLSHSSDKTTRNHVVLHPNTPKEVLLKLAHQFPADFFRNPAFDWLLLEDPDLMQHIGRNVLGTLLKRPDCPQSFLNWAVKHGTEKERLAVAMNPDASVEALRILKADSGTISKAAKAHKKIARNGAESDPLAILEKEIRAELKKTWTKGYARYIEAPWKAQVIGPAQWFALSLEAKLAATGIDLPGSGRKPSSGFSEEWRAERVPRLQPRPVEELRQKALSKSEDVRISVALNPACPIDVIETLAKDKSEIVRVWVAQSPTCPEPLSHQLLSALATSKSKETLRKVVGFLSTPEDIRRKIFMALLEQSGPKGWVDLLYAPGCLSDIAETIQARLWRNQMRALGKKSGTEILVCEVLEHLDDKSLLQAARIELEALRQEGNDLPSGDPVEPSLLSRVIGADRTKSILSLPLEAADHAARSTEIAIRLIGLYQQHTAPDILAKKSKSSDWTERLAIACNPSCPPAISTRLQSDPNRIVAAGAMQGASQKSSLIAAREALVAETCRVDWPLLAKQVAQRLQSSRAVQALELVSRCRWKGFIAPDALLGEEARTLLMRDNNCPADFRVQLWTRQIERANKWGPGLLAADPDCPPELLEWFAKKKDASLRAAVARNTACPASLLHELASDKDENVRGEVAKNPAIPKELLELLTQDASQSVRWGIAQNPSCPESLFKPLSLDKNERTRWTISENTNCSVEILTQLAGDKDRSVRHAVAGNPSCPVEVLGILATDKEGYVRRAVAGNPSCPATNFERLASDPDSDVREAVAGNPSCPAEILDRLAGDRNLQVRSRIAKHVSCSASSFELLANDQDRGIRWEVAKNPACPKRFLDVLLGSDVRAQVAENPACPANVLEALARDEDRYVRRAVAENPACPASILDTLARDEYNYARSAIASKTDCPVNVFDVLARDGDRYVRNALAENPSCPRHLLDILASDGDPGIVFNVIHHPNATSDQLTRWARDNSLHPFLRLVCTWNSQFPGTKKALADEIARLADEPPQIPEKIMDDEWCLAFKALGLYPEDKKEVAKAAKAKDWLQRAAATFSPDIQPNQLKLLLEDSEEVVRQLAADRLRQRESAKV